MREMRFHHTEGVDLERLKAFAMRCESPRVVEAVKVWGGVCGSDAAGSIDL